MLASELDGASQEGQSDARAPVTVVDGEARHPPDSRFIVAEGFRKSPVASHPWKAIPGSDPRPADRIVSDIGDETRRYRSVRDLLVQRLSVVW
jgi:hypothetical protein